MRGNCPNEIAGFLSINYNSTKLMDCPGAFKCVLDQNFWVCSRLSPNESLAPDQVQMCARSGTDGAKATI